MKTIQKTQTTIQEPYQHIEYCVIEDGEVKRLFSELEYEHNAIDSQRAYYDNLKAYYTRTGVEFEEV